MSFKNNYVDELNQLLMKRRNDDDSAFTLNIPEHRLKRNADKFNWALKTIYEKHLEEESEVLMFHIVLSLQQFFDMEWAVENLLDSKNVSQIKAEMMREYKIKPKDDNEEE